MAPTTGTQRAAARAIGGTVDVDAEHIVSSVFDERAVAGAWIAAPRRGGPGPARTD